MPIKFAWSTLWKNCIWIIFDQIHQIQRSNTNTNTLNWKTNTHIQIQIRIWPHSCSGHRIRFYEWMHGKKHFCFFQTAETGKRTMNSSLKFNGANHYPRAPTRGICLTQGHNIKTTSQYWEVRNMNILHQAGLETARQAATLINHCDLTIAPCPTLFIHLFGIKTMPLTLATAYACHIRLATTTSTRDTFGWKLQLTLCSQAVRIDCNVLSFAINRLSAHLKPSIHILVQKGLWDGAVRPFARCGAFPAW